MYRVIDTVTNEVLLYGRDLNLLVELVREKSLSDWSNVTIQELSEEELMKVAPDLCFNCKQRTYLI